MGRSFAKAKVVVADDDADIRLLIRRVLEIDGRFVVVGEAGDGAEAITVVEETHPDAIVLDLMMVGMSGFDAIPKIRKCSPATAIAAYSSSAGQRRALDAGADGFILKGTAAHEIVAMLRELIAARRRR